MQAPRPTPKCGPCRALKSAHSALRGVICLTPRVGQFWPANWSVKTHADSVPPRQTSAAAAATLSVAADATKNCGVNVHAHARPPLQSSGAAALELPSPIDGATGTGVMSGWRNAIDLGSSGRFVVGAPIRWESLSLIRLTTSAVGAR